MLNKKKLNEIKPNQEQRKMNDTLLKISDLLKTRQNFDIFIYDENFYTKSLSNRILNTNCSNEKEYLNFFCIQITMKVTILYNRYL